MIRLERRDPAKNMQRYYELEMSPTLFGGWMLTQKWGRIGRAGQSKQSTFDTLLDAAVRMCIIARQKEGRGYR